MTTHVLVESLSHVEEARQHIDGPIRWYSTSPVVVESLERSGEPVEWADAAISAKSSDAIGLACRAAVLAVEPALRTVAERLATPALVPFVGQQLAYFLGLLCYKRAIVEAFAHSGGQTVIIGVPGLTGGGGGHFGIGAFDTVFRNIAGGLECRLLDGKDFDRSVLEADFDRGTVSDRIVSLADISRAQRLSRQLRFLKASRIGPSNAKATVFVGRDNDTIREMLPPLLDRGIALARLPRPQAPVAGDPQEGLPDASALSEALKQAFTDHDLTIDPAIPAGIAAERLQDASRYWQSARDAALASVDEMRRGDAQDGAAAIITNTIGSLAGCMQAAAAEDAGIPTILVEHGVSAGLSRYHEPIRIWAEPVHGTAYLACAQNASDFFLEEPRTAQVHFHTIGLAEQTRRVPLRWMQRLLARFKFKPRPRERIVVYLARASQNNFRKLSYAPRDCDLYELQNAMCRTVMPKIRGRSVVKLYSTRRYIDGDAFWDLERAPAPVQTIKTGDFRFFRGGVDLILMESPLSTIGWAFGTGKPIIYLADPGAPLIPEIRDRMEKSVFLVDLAEPDWHDKVVEIANRPDAAILAEWRAKADARDAFLRDCVFGPEEAGRRGADAVELEIGLR
ncbi:hypothetical protein [Pacificispira sp.]|uniref:hypothetical protein n=1 Tax=Pacificispira sp. TaxID=2888761 RepID=UPI003B52E8CA